MESLIIMVIEDEEQMRKMIRTFLEKEGYEVVEATDGTHAISILDEINPHLLIVDVMMPFMDGFSFVKEVKGKLESSIPLIFLSARGEEWDTVHGLKLGGDDYIVKPFKPMEFLARIESVLRRTYGQQVETDTVTIGPLVINADSYEAKLNEHNLALTRKEFGLLSILAKNNGRAYTREQLLQIVWGDSHQSSERTVDTHIKTLRLKMGSDGGLIKTVWGIGYKFEV